MTQKEGWDDSKYARNETWDTYDYGLQLGTGARWDTPNSTVLRVGIDFYYTAPTLSDTEVFTVTIPVDSAFENVNVTNFSAGTATYDADSHTIIWNISGKPFEFLSLEYSCVLSAELSGLLGSRSYNVTNDNITVGDLLVDILNVPYTR